MSGIDFRKWLSRYDLFFILLTFIAISLMAGCGSDAKRKRPDFFKVGPSSQELAGKLGLGDDDRLGRGDMLVPPDKYLPGKIEVQTLDGKSASLVDNRGHWLLLHYFTTYSSASQLQMPAFGNMLVKYGRRGLRVVGISLDLQGSLMVYPFLEAMNITYPVFLAAGESKEGKTPYGFIEAIPLALVIDPNGRLVKGYVGPVKAAEIEAELKSRLPAAGKEAH